MSHAAGSVWEYTVIEPPRGPTMEEAVDPTAELNELGVEGWELVTTIEYNGGGTKYLVFKRPASATDGSREHEQ